MEDFMSNLYLGADVSKGYVDIVVLDRFGKKYCHSERYYDSPNGHAAISRKIKSFFRDPDVTQILAATESTGGYENNWMARFKKLGEEGYKIHTTRLNPRQTLHYSKTVLTRTVTDSVSALTIAEFLRRAHDKLRFDENDTFKPLRKLWKSCQLLQKAHKAQQQYLEILLYECNPSVIQYMRKHVNKWILDVLFRYPTAKKLGAARVSTLSKIPYVTRKRAEELVSQAKNSIASDEAYVSEVLIRQTIKAIRDLKKHIKTLQKQLIEQGRMYNQVNLVNSIAGIGMLSAVGLVINIGDLSRFTDAKHLSSFFGVHPVFKQSGDGKTISRMSKCGRSQPRAILYMATLSGVNINPILKKTFSNAKAKGKAPMAAIGICMHKLLRLVYGVLKSGNKFDTAVHDQHVARAVSVKYDQTKTKNHMNCDLCAPVSVRKARKIRKNGPQNAHFALSTGSPPSQ